VPFIVRMGEVVTLRCDTYPLSGVEFKWFDEDTNNTNFSKGNDLYEVQWIAPMKPGYYSISVQANYYHQSLSGKVVVLVK